MSDRVVHLMPDGTIAPEIMTVDEVIRYLRIDTLRNPRRVIAHLRSARRLKSVRICKVNHYRIGDVVEYLDTLAKESV